MRAYNCLIRANLYTLADVKNLMDTDPDSFIKIRNLGTMSRNDVIEKMEEYGVDCSAVRKAAECIHYP